MYVGLQRRTIDPIRGRRQAHWAEQDDGARIAGRRNLVDADAGAVVDDGQLAFELRRTDFDVDALLQIARDSGMPYADWWIGSWQDEDG